AVTNRCGGVPLPAKVHIFDAKISCDQQLGAPCRLKKGTVVANALYHRAWSVRLAGELSNASDQLPFSHEIAVALNISKIMSCSIGSPCWFKQTLIIKSQPG